MIRKFTALFTVVALLAILVVAAGAQDDESFALTIMHTNDTHAAHAADGDGNGGVARQATVVNAIRAEVENSILLDAGDRFSGTLFHSVYIGQDQIPIMNALGYDAMTLGNHEFDNGDQALADFIAGLEFPVVTANIDFSESPELSESGIEAFVMLEVGGEQIGVIGLDTVDTIEIASPGDALIWNDDYAGVANAAAAELMDMGVNKIILLTHLGIGDDLPMIEQLEGIDIVLGGHSHTLYSNTYQGAQGEYPLEFTSAAGEPIYYAQASANNEYLGRMDVEFDADGIITDIEGDTIFLSRFITPDADVQAIVDELNTEIEAIQAEPVGVISEVALDGDRTVCRVEECNLGNIIADAWRWETGAQIGLMNGGGIRRDLPSEEELTLGMMLELQPFGNQISTFELTGADLLVALENSVSRIEFNEDGLVTRQGASGRFLQVSGLRFSFDPNLNEGSRIVEVEVENADGEFEALDPEAVYSVAAPNFIRGGGDGYAVFAESAINPYDFGRVDYEVTVDYMRTLSPVTMTVDPNNPRINMMNAVVEPR